MARVTISVDEQELENDEGFSVDGITVTCDRCGHSVEVYGTSKASIKRGAVMLRDECPMNAHNFYVESNPQ